MHERLGDPRPRARWTASDDDEGVPHERGSAAIGERSTDVMVPLRARRGRPCRGLLARTERPAARFPSTLGQGRASDRPSISAACRMSGKVTKLKFRSRPFRQRSRTTINNLRLRTPDVRIVAIADAAADNWTFLETLSPETEVIDFWHACEHLRTASDHAVVSDWFERYREVLRHDPCGVDKVIRALRHLRDSAKPDRAEIERELAGVSCGWRVASCYEQDQLRRHRFPAEIIQRAVWLCFRFPHQLPRCAGGSAR